MGLTRAGDRPIAIKGLEARLIQTFGGRGGYGVFQIYLHRCLLWKRAGPTLNPISSFPGGLVPSWSWMAYEGGIKFVDAPGSDVKWQTDVTWPLSRAERKIVRDARGGQRSDNDGEVGPELEAPVWNWAEPHPDGIFLDDGSPTVAPTTKCVVIGVNRWAPDDEHKKHYVLIVGPARSTAGVGEVWKRLGVGIVERRHIALGGPKNMVRIQ